MIRGVSIARFVRRGGLPVLVLPKRKSQLDVAWVGPSTSGTEILEIVSVVCSSSIAYFATAASGNSLLVPDKARGFWRELVS